MLCLDPVPRPCPPPFFSSYLAVVRLRGVLGAIPLYVPNFRVICTTEFTHEGKVKCSHMIDNFNASCTEHKDDVIVGNGVKKV